MIEPEVRSEENTGAPPALQRFAHVSLPCRNLEEGVAFYADVLGGQIRVSVPTFASFLIAGVNLGIGTDGCSFVGMSAEYPHIAFYVGPDELLQWKSWLSKWGIPTSNLWSRLGKEALMFTRDPSDNVIEFFCAEGFEGAAKLPRGPARGGGIAVDLDSLRYTSWVRPPKGSRDVVWNV